MRAVRQVDKKSINEFELLLPDHEGEASPNSSDLILYTQLLRFTGESYSMIHFCVIAKRRPYYYFISVCLQHSASVASLPRPRHCPAQAGRRQPTRMLDVSTLEYP